MARPPKPSPHDRALFEQAMALVRPQEPALRTGAMFGCPAAFLGRRLAFCVYRDRIGAKLPPEEARRLRATGLAEAFTPYGRTGMRGWVSLSGQEAGLAAILALAVGEAGARRQEHRAKRVARKASAAAGPGSGPGRGDPDA
ncbi:hypothetical protein LPC08_12815 [Roseomonas sp. OT10]|uniref:hypothetical protein n=1 Tax=Roseomonas cutis TaxID=2897332 RepID=UPI001E37B689|nr:hypothetical protein [Roseomonas sp. OT10]UFN46912.1 hypothetical protein LPC08_12815 [Roseomonas sp. OT10]